eukprot:g30442.t1
MRAVPLHRVLACVGKVFWTAEGDFFQLSKETTSYDEFLSHSWQVESWKKVLLLMILKNGFPASVIGTSGALLMVVLWQFGFLPGFVKLEFQSDGHLVIAVVVHALRGPLIKPYCPRILSILGSEQP